MQITFSKPTYKALITSFIFLLLIAIFYPVRAQNAGKDEIQWISIEEAVNKSAVQPRKLLVYIYSDNCGWCKKMSSISFSEQEIINYINENYYPVKLNASITRDIKLGDRTYKYVNANPSANSPAYHELVLTLLNGRMAYPAIAFISEKMEYMGVDFGYKNPKLLEAWLHFIAEEAYKTTPDFTAFQADFKGKL
ncbi:MAG: DUF255 domain-containing protein [Bacteroidales bacterium]|nr:DUF255 domain-containing protein [Bacteroidales bacterium]